MLIDDEEIADTLKKKYELVTNIENNGFTMKLPCSIESVNPIYNDLINVIEVSREDD
jgi:hypothetical protein